MSAPDINRADEEAVLRVLRSGVLALGPEAEAFEQDVARLAGRRHAVAVSSGTAGLHLLVRSLGLGPEDECLVPSFTFASSVNALLFEGVRPVFVDIDPETYNLDPRQVELNMTDRTRGVMVVDVFGQPADWSHIQAVIAGHDVKVIDDACEALGATYEGRPIGSFGDAACFAFYPNKQITTGEGGMIVTDDDTVAATCRSLRNQGRTDAGSWLEHERLGYNYRMDEMSAALGRSQVARLGGLLQQRHEVAARYTELLSPYEWVRVLEEPPRSRMSWFVYVVTLARELDRTAIMSRLSAQGIASRAYFSPIHLQPYVRERFHTREGMLPVTEDIASRTLALPFHSNLRDAEVERVVEALVHAVED